MSRTSKILSPPPASALSPRKLLRHLETRSYQRLKQRVAVTVTLCSCRPCGPEVLSPAAAAGPGRAGGPRFPRGHRCTFAAPVEVSPPRPATPLLPREMQQAEAGLHRQPSAQKGVTTLIFFFFFSKKSKKKMKSLISLTKT